MKATIIQLVFMVGLILAGAFFVADLVHSAMASTCAVTSVLAQATTTAETK